MRRYVPLLLASCAALLLYAGLSAGSGCGVANVRAIHHRAAVYHAAPVVQHHAAQHYDHGHHQAFSVYNAGGADALEIERLKLEVARTQLETSKVQLDVQKLRLEAKAPAPAGTPAEQKAEPKADGKKTPAPAGKISCVACHSADDKAAKGDGLVLFTDGQWSGSPKQAAKGIVSMMKGRMPKGVELAPEQFADHVEFLAREAAK